MKNKIAFIIPYYGNIPPYFHLFKESVIGKPFDVIIFSDSKQPNNLPDNLKWIFFPIKEVEALLFTKLKLSFTLRKLYKLCDFKPMYGFLFENYIRDYDFWGTIDIDTVVGNFELFINDELLNQIDVYSGIKEYISGSLFLLKNDERCRNLFMKSKDWEKVVLSDDYLGFDECGGKYYSQLKKGISIFDLNTPIQSFTEIIFREQNNGLKLHFVNQILEPSGYCPIHVESDRIMYNSSEYIILHLIYFKWKYYFFVDLSVLPAPYFISQLGTFKNNPDSFVILFSKNLWRGVVFRKFNNILKKVSSLFKAHISNFPI